MNLLWNHRDYCFPTNHPMMLQWSQLVILILPSFGDSTVKSLLPLFCDKSSGCLIWCHFGTCHKATVIVTSQCSLQTMATWLVAKLWPPSDFIVMSPGDSSQSQIYSDLAVVPPKDLSMNETKILLHCSAVTMTLVTICYIRMTGYAIKEVHICYTCLLYQFILASTINFRVRKLAFCLCSLILWRTYVYNFSTKKK